MHINMAPLAQGRRKKWSLFSLFFSLFFWVPFFTINSQFSPIVLALSLSIYASFIGAYLWGINASTQKVHWPIFTIVLVATVGVGANLGSLALYGFAAFILGYHYRIKIALVLLVATLIAQIGICGYLGFTNVTLIATPMLSAACLFVFGAFERKEELHRCAEETSAQELERVSTIAERERIGRDLHDLAGHALSSIALKAELAGKLIDKNRVEEARQELFELADAARTLLSDIRKAVSEIKYQPLEQEIESLISLLRHQGFSVDAKITDSPFVQFQEQQIILMLKELVTNVLRHAKGNRVDISLVVKNQNVELQVCNDGQVATVEYGNGLLGIATRASQFNGALTVDNEDGVKVKITMEYAQ